jgi:hypothetical protein
MSNTVKIVIGVIILLVLLVLAFGMGGEKGNAPVGGTDTSDQALQGDTSAIDAEMQGLEGDRAVIDQGLEENVSAE